MSWGECGNNSMIKGTNLLVSEILDWRDQKHKITQNSEFLLAQKPRAACRFIAYHLVIWSQNIGSPETKPTPGCGGA